MDISTYTRKDIGNLGERIAAEYLRRKGFLIVDRNVARKTGELDIIVRKADILHFVEVKTVLCTSFPDDEPSTNHRQGEYDPSANLHPYKIRKVTRTAEWYVADHAGEEEWQIDGILVWIRKSDAIALVRYYPQIL